jgi:hypothetical protein
LFLPLPTPGAHDGFRVVAPVQTLFRDLAADRDSNVRKGPFEPLKPYFNHMGLQFRQYRHFW